MPSNNSAERKAERKKSALDRAAKAVMRECGHRHLPNTVCWHPEPEPDPKAAAALIEAKGKKPTRRGRRGKKVE
jgi:ribosomal protein L32